MTYIQAALTILAHADRPLTVGELTSVAVADGLVRPRGKTPDRTMASVLYRRMATDPDAPVICRTGRFWLRGRPLPASEATYLERRARRARMTVRRTRRGSPTARRVSVLPPPPIRLPSEALRAVDATARFRATDYTPARRERAIARAGDRGARLLARLDARRSEDAVWDVARTDTRLVAPLLAHLGYRRDVEPMRIERAGRGARGYLLHAGGAPAIALVVRRLTHDLGDDDGWHALSHARQMGVGYAAVTNGREVRVYSVAVAEAQDDPAAALTVVLDLTPAAGSDEARARQAAALWLLSREAVAAGALDAYTVDCAVGAALISALDAPDSPLARALVVEARSRLGVALPANLLLRHARLVVRGRRGRDGEPLPDDVAAVAAVRGPRVENPTAEIAQSA